MLKAGTETGSLINHLYSRMTKGAPAPEVGMGATMLAWTDRYAATVVSVEGNVVGVKRDNATVISGSTFDGSAKYEYSPDDSAPTEFWRMDEAKGWRKVRKNDKGRFVLAEGNGLILGMRREYCDPSF